MFGGWRGSGDETSRSICKDSRPTHLKHLDRLNVEQLRRLRREQNDRLHAAHLTGVRVNLPEPTQNLQDRLHLRLGQQILGQPVPRLATLQHARHVEGNAPLGQVQQKQLFP